MTTQGPLDPRLIALAYACERIATQLPISGFKFNRNKCGMRLELEASTDGALTRLAATFELEVKQIHTDDYEWQQARADFEGVHVVIDGPLRKKSKPLVAKRLDAAIAQLAEAAPEPIPDP